MLLEHLRTANMIRLERFGHGDLTEGWNVAEWGCAAAGEMGELCNILKKINRNASFDPPLEDLRLEAADEIADTMIYLDLIAAKLDLNLGEIIVFKFNKTSEAKGFPEKL